MQRKSVFVIRQKSDRNINNYNNYTFHGTFRGVDGVMSYGDLKDARKFLTQEDAQAYINHELPEWARKNHCPVEVGAFELMFKSPELAVLLLHGDMEIPLRLLTPTRDE